MLKSKQHKVHPQSDIRIQITNAIQKSGKHKMFLAETQKYYITEIITAFTKERIISNT